MKTFVLNGKAYPAKEIGFNMICDMEDKHISLDEIEEKPMRIMRMYIADCMGTDEAVAGKEIENHVINGGDLGEIVSVLSDAMEASGFFQALSKRAEKETTTRKKKEAKIVEITEA